MKESVLEKARGQVGQLARLNGRGDLAFYGWLRPYIGEAPRRLCVVVKVTKGGLVYIRDWKRSGLRFSVPARNIEII